MPGFFRVKRTHRYKSDEQGACIDMLKTTHHRNRTHAAQIWLLAVGCWLLAVGCWLLAVGCWLLAVGCWQVAVGRWLLAGGRWQVAGGRWQVAGGRWQVAGGRWQVAGGILSGLPTILTTSTRHVPNGTTPPECKNARGFSPLAFSMAHDGRYSTPTIVFFVEALWVHAEEIDPFTQGNE